MFNKNIVLAALLLIPQALLPAEIENARYTFLFSQIDTKKALQPIDIISQAFADGVALVACISPVAAFVFITAVCADKYKEYKESKNATMPAKNNLDQRVKELEDNVHCMYHNVENVTQKADHLTEKLDLMCNDMREIDMELTPIFEQLKEDVENSKKTGLHLAQRVQELEDNVHCMYHNLENVTQKAEHLTETLDNHLYYTEQE